MVEYVHSSECGADSDNVANERCCEVGELEITNFLYLFLNASIDIEFEAESYENTWDHDIS